MNVVKQSGIVYVLELKNYSMKKIVCCLLLVFFTSSINAQELNCIVKLNYDQLFAQQTTNDNTLGQLQNVISDFINSRRWTTDNFNTDERINCKITINLVRSVSQGNYEGNAQIVVTRPVFGSNYETVIFNYVDRNFNFGYLPNNPLYFNENSYSDELTHLLAYYSYIILAVDYDTFSKQGGNSYIQKAFSLANLAQTASGSAGWKSSGDIRNRYWLTENFMNQQMTPYRDGQYNYHRLALDSFTENPVAARKQVLEVLNNISEVSKIRTTSVLINSFFDSKSDEIYKILSPATRDERQKAFNVLSQLDPAKTELYRKLLR